MKLTKLGKLLAVTSLLLLAAGQLFGAGNKEIPDVPPITSGTQYFSPDSNGVKDTAVLSFSVKVYVKSDEGYVPEYGIQILDSSGNVMKEIVETEKSDIGWFASIFRGYSEFSLDRSISWDGTDKAGKKVQDGVYNVKLWVVDSSKNRKDIDVEDFVVDTKKPQAELVKPESMIFSPNGDDFLDTFTIGHVNASEEALWEASILDESGNIIHTFSWKNEAPDKAVWDGTDNTGSPVSAGTYSYSLTSTDEAGNVADPIVLEGITLDLTKTTVALVIDKPSISPDGNGINDFMTVYMDQAVKEGIESWEWQILNNNGVVYWKVTGKGDVPKAVVFNGNDSDGNPMPEGDYNFVYKVFYRNGNRPSALEPFVIDVTAPEINFTVTNSVFSPNGDGLKDDAEIKFKSNGKVSWKGSILDSKGNEVITTSSNNTTSLIVWDGTDKDGAEVSDGDYTLIASFTDSAGNSTSIEPSVLTVNREPVTISLKTSKGFSPDNDGSSDSMIILVDTNLDYNLESWNLDIVDMDGNVVSDIPGSDNLPPELVWDGSVVDSSGSISLAKEGTYSARLSAVYLKGDRVDAVSDNFVLDLTAPRVSMDVAADPFASSDKGIVGDVYLTLKVLDNTAVENWSMEVLNTNGDILRTYSGKGDPTGSITWNSTDSNSGTGASIENPDYVLKLTVTDLGGNESVYKTEIPLDILLVLKDGKKYLSVPNIIFGAYKYSLGSAGAEQLASNNSSLDRVASIYKKYPAYGLVLEGHALNIYLGGQREAAEEKILLPLTANRASTVKSALVDRGIEESKISTEAYGGQHPIASVTDRKVWWKNRRVEFVMTDPAE